MSLPVNCPDCGYPMMLVPYLGYHWAWVCRSCHPEVSATTDASTRQWQPKQTTEDFIMKPVNSTRPQRREGVGNDTTAISTGLVRVLDVRVGVRGVEPMCHEGQ